MKKIIIDGYNLIHSIPQLKLKVNHDLETARYDLINILSRYKSKKKVDIIVIFDGRLGSIENEEKEKGIEVRFSHSPEKADQVIKRMIDQNEREKGVMVVSSDREIFDYAKVCGLQVIKSEYFAKELLPSSLKKKKKKSEPKMNAQELQEWMRLFGK